MTEIINQIAQKSIILERKLATTKNNKPINWYIEQEVKAKKWHEETISPEITGLTRALTVYRAPRKTNLITYDWHGDKDTFCPPQWWDLAIGSGACGLGCRSCFLMLTHRIKRDPLAHLLYDNIADFTNAAEKWLADPKRRRQHTLGVGIDRSDSLLYEGVTGQVRSLAPLFANNKTNPNSNKLILLTKSATVGYLQEIKPEQRKNIIVTFSLNPEAVADLWEGKWPDTFERISPSVANRLEAAKYTQDLGFEVRVRLDPILTPDDWESYYQQFILDIKKLDIAFSYWTLGTYREKNQQLDSWRERWGLPAMEWLPGDNELIKEGTHRHLPEARRIEIYRKIQNIIRLAFPQAKISLCKETHQVRKAVALCNANCNCLT